MSRSNSPIRLSQRSVTTDIQYCLIIHEWTNDRRNVIDFVHFQSRVSVASVVERFSRNSRRKTTGFLRRSIQIWVQVFPLAASRLSVNIHLVWFGWEINVPFQHKNRLYQGQGLGWRSSSARLRMANDTVTFRPRCLFVQWRPKMGKDRGGSFKLLD